MFDQLRAMVAVESHGQVDEPADHPTESGFGDTHLAADQPAEKQHAPKHAAFAPAGRSHRI
ncbi:MAG: hypothetical protein NTY24_02855 [Mycobacterium sp.]|nr:hypothetical protein [Mycobacterium sp.]